jgi:hypothetical protein
LLQTMMDSIPGHVFGKDLNLNYILCNKYLLNFFNLDEKKLSGRTILTG